MNNIKDETLSTPNKILLIQAIKDRQQERWDRLKRFHSLTNINMNDRHYFMKKEIELIRGQRDRLNKLIQNVYQ